MAPRALRSLIGWSCPMNSGPGSSLNPHGHSQICAHGKPPGQRRACPRVNLNCKSEKLARVALRKRLDPTVRFMLPRIAPRNECFKMRAEHMASRNCLCERKQRAGELRKGCMQQQGLTKLARGKMESANPSLYIKIFDLRPVDEVRPEDIRG